MAEASFHNYTVSIIIPTLNEEKWIERCIDSLTVQSFPFQEMEVIVVDGGSCDKTINIVKGLFAKFKNIRLLNNPNKIQSVAFNIGVENSTAPFVIRLDAHSVYNKDYIINIIRHLDNPKYGNVGGRWIVKAQREGLIPEANAIANQMRFAIGGADYRVNNVCKEVETVPFGGFRREVVENIGPMNSNLPRGEDNEYNRRILDAGYKILFDPKIVAYYYSRDTFKGFIKQMYSNGISIGILFYCYRKAIGLRHLIPLLFTVSLILLLILSFVTKYAVYILLVELIIYFILDIFSSLQECRKHGYKFILILPWLILCIHVAYGLGTIEGLIKKNYK